jgi:signal transduction histidine kinase
MEKVPLVLAAVTVGLLAAQAALVLVRCTRCVRRIEPLLLAVLLACLCLRAVSIPAPGAGTVVAVACIGAGGAFLSRACARRGGGTLSLAALAFLGLLGLFSLLGYGGGIPFTALRTFGIAGLAVYPVCLLVAAWRASASPVALLTLACVSLCIAGSTVDGALAMAGIECPVTAGASLLLPLALCTGWLVFEEGYPSRPGWRGSLPGLRDREGLDGKMLGRLMENEGALERQEKIIASGFLAMAAAHEFKNTLSGIRAAAQHGVRHPDQAMACLGLVLEHADVARDSAIAGLESISVTEQPRRLEADRDLAECIRMARLALRPSGIAVECDLAPGVAFNARRSDVEQIVLNLARNSAEAYGASGCPAGIVHISARCIEDNVVIEVRDDAGGVAPEQESLLFTLGSSGTGSTGLGLWLSRRLAAVNGGALDYLPLEGGSLFRLVFPAKG